MSGRLKFRKRRCADPKPLDLSCRQDSFQLDRFICYVAIIANKDLSVLTSVGNSYVQFDTKSFCWASLKSASPMGRISGCPSNKAEHFSGTLTAKSLMIPWNDLVSHFFVSH